VQIFCCQQLFPYYLLHQIHQLVEALHHVMLHILKGAGLGSDGKATWLTDNIPIHTLSDQEAKLSMQRPSKMGVTVLTITPIATLLISGISA
jgi:hypothetical protein